MGFEACDFKSFMNLSKKGEAQRSDVHKLIFPAPVRVLFCHNLSILCILPQIPPTGNILSGLKPNTRQIQNNIVLCLYSTLEWMAL